MSKRDSLALTLTMIAIVLFAYDGGRCTGMTLLGMMCAGGAIYNLTIGYDIDNMKRK